MSGPFPGLRPIERGEVRKWVCRLEPHSSLMEHTMFNRSCHSIPRIQPSRLSNSSRSLAARVGTVVILLLGISAAHAQQDENAVSLPRVKVLESVTYTLAPREADAYLGVYRFDSGHTLKVWQRGARYHGRLSGQASLELKPTAAGRFETDAGVALVFFDEGRSVAVGGWEGPMLATR
jgi:hypothetical protein